MVPSQPVGTRAPGPLVSEELYLGLLKGCLTRYLFSQDVAAFVPERRWMRQVWSAVSRLLARKGFVVLRRGPFQPELREDGRDWPPTAETMIGLRRLDNTQSCIQDVVRDGVAGDLIETGVWRGGSAIFMRAVLAALGDTSRTVWVADSFAGLPPPDPANPADEGDLHWTQPFLAVSLEEVKANFARYGLLDDQVRFLPGWFGQTLPTADIERLAVLRVDCDMYSSTMDVLRALYPKVAAGGYVIIDDYGAVPACRTAVDEYRDRHEIDEPLCRIDWTGVYWRRSA